MLTAIIVSLLTGVTLVTSRVANGKLAEHSSALTSTFYNYLIGLLVSLMTLFAIGRGEMPLPSGFISSNVWMYSGGLISVFVVFICAAVAPKIPTFYMTLLIFVGQLFASIIIDTLLTQQFSLGKIIGGMLAAIGFSYNLLEDKKSAALTESL